MADTKIASLTDGLTTSGTDRIPVAISPYGSGNNAYITPSYLKTFMVTGGTVTSSTPVFDMTQTWNSGAVTFSGLKLNVTDTASASGSLLLDLQVGGSSKASIRKDGAATFAGAIIGSGNGGAFLTGGVVDAVSASSATVALGWNIGQIIARSSGVIGFSSSSNASSGINDVSLVRDAANTLALQNGTNAQTFNIYNTWSSAGANYERGSIGFATPSNGVLAFTINGGAAGGTGTGRELWLKAANNIYLGGSAGYNWTVNNTGHFLAGADNIYDIGASGANRPRNVYVAGLLTVSGQSLFANNAGFSGSGNIRMANSAGYIIPQSDGVWQICDNTTTSFGRLQFGGTSSSFPALKRSTTSLQARLADDSAFTAIQGKLTTDTAYTATPPTCTGYVTIYDSTGTPYKVMVST